jgi:1-phosphatidylinositol phosphodiesterase
MAIYGWPFAQCQLISTPLHTQLHSGIRVLDVRLSNINGKLIAYHDIIPQRVPFTKILETINTFLTAPESCQEALVMSIKQEDFRKTSVAKFSELVRKEITDSKGGLDMWFLDNRIPTLGEVRGKVVMFSRFEDDGGWVNGLEGMGIHPTTWPDSRKEGFEWDCKNTLVRTHDW